MEFVMTRPDRFRRALPLILAVGLCISPPRAHGLVVTCTNCGTEFTQLANNLQLADQLARQIELVQQSIRQSENLLLNTAGLDRFQFGNALSELKQVSGVLAQAKALSFASSGLEAKFAEKYQDYGSYLRQQIDVEALGQKYQQWSEDTNSSVLTALKAAGLHTSQIEGSEDALFKQLESLATTAEGRMQALQTGNQIALAAARQTQKLRQIMLTQIWLQAMYMQMRADRDASQEAAWRNFNTPQTLTTGNGKRY
jgi:P-type conjugative transfer protein TrbJ